MRISHKNDIAKFKVNALMSNYQFAKLSLLTTFLLSLVSQQPSGLVASVLQVTVQSGARADKDSMCQRE